MFGDPAAVVLVIIRVVVGCAGLFALGGVGRCGLADLLPVGRFFAGCRIRRGGDGGAIDCESLPVFIDLSDAGDAFQLKIHLADAHLANRFACLFLDQLGWDTVVDDRGVVLSDVIIHHLGFVVNDGYIVVMNPMPVQASMPEIGVIAVSVVMMAQTEVKPDADPRPVPHVAHTGDVVATRGQRCPAAVNVGRPPVYPSRAPAVAGHPVPTVDA